MRIDTEMDINMSRQASVQSPNFAAPQTQEETFTETQTEDIQILSVQH